jgi:hypothetical protein
MTVCEICGLDHDKEETHESIRELVKAARGIDNLEAVETSPEWVLVKEAGVELVNLLPGKFLQAIMSGFWAWIIVVRLVLQATLALGIQAGKAGSSSSLEFVVGEPGQGTEEE